jgi:hypothetical protein
VRSDGSRLGAALRNSLLRRVRDWLTPAESGDQDTAPGRVGTIIKRSWLYRWLTAEPEPDVIVIDLRETRTLGPFITLLDRFIAWLAPYWRQSGLKRAVDGGVAMLDRAADTRAGQLAARVLAPPAPPETRDSAEDASNDDRKQSASQE